MSPGHAYGLYFTDLPFAYGVPAMTRLSIFDLDRTLTIRPTYSAFLLFAAWSMARWRICLLPLLIPFAGLYAVGLIKRRTMKQIMQRTLLGGGVPRPLMQRMADAYAQSLLREGLYVQGRRLIAREQAAGRRVILATAAPAFYAVSIAEAMGVRDVVATESVWSEDRLTSRIAGDNCYGPAKLRMLEEFLSGAGLDRGRAHIRFFSDHASDNPTFMWCDEPVAVNPSAKLHAIAQRRGWRILDWRPQGAFISFAARWINANRPHRLNEGRVKAN